MTPEAIVPEEVREATDGLHATGRLARIARKRTTDALLRKNYTQEEIDEAITEVESDRPLLDLFMTYIFPLLLKLLENLILSKRASV